MRLQTVIPAIMMVFALGNRMAQGQTNSAEMNGTLETTCNCLGDRPVMINAEYHDGDQLTVVRHKPSTGYIEFIENARKMVYNGEFIGYKGEKQKYNINDDNTPENLTELAQEMAKNSKQVCQSKNTTDIHQWNTVKSTKKMKSNLEKSL